MSNPVTINLPVMGCYTPAETVELVSRAGYKKGNMRPDKIFLSAVSGGCLLSFGAAASLSVTTAPWFQENAPGLIRLVGGIVFPVGLVMIVLTGAELFTGSNMYTAVAALHGRITVHKMLLHWLLCFLGNLAGSLFVMAIIIGYGGVFDKEPYRTQVINFVTSKQVKPVFHQIFLRAIGCNWLVCLACYLGMQAKDLSAKVVGMWWPILTFVTLGFDHVVANMFFIPLGLWLGTPGLTVELYIWKGIIPAGLGNILGGAVFCGAYYYWMFVFQQPETSIDGTYFQAELEEGRLPRTTSRNNRPMEHGFGSEESRDTSHELKEDERRAMR
ncbi:Formate/nitrite transporter-domain-containing protein [Echria macrotheca]|uniref:Formate/nitrite transporter-domain-containing protein n=1 Tax=Echria macrotheca TaxID=438768 RepID=A0AAJ0F8F1_9PEZI|nr:Formate/nitrite transporter-domain-containing protein [Echria macrotheca]